MSTYELRTELSGAESWAGLGWAVSFLCLLSSVSTVPHPPLHLGPSLLSLSPSLPSSVWPDLTACSAINQPSHRVRAVRNWLRVETSQIAHPTTRIPTTTPTIAQPP